MVPMNAQPQQNIVLRLAVVLLLAVSAFTAANAQGVPPPCVPDPANEDAVLEWNCRAVKYALSPTFGGALRQIRAMAVVQLAVHNAVNSVTRGYETYSRDPANVPPANASTDAAAIGAAYQALYAMVTPTQQTALDAELAASISARGIAADDPSLVYG